MKFFKKFSQFLVSKKRFLPPKKNKILVCDDLTGRKIFNYLKKDFSILHTRLEEINLFILFVSLKSIISGEKLSKAYLLNYIKYASPKVIITCNDVDRFYWSLKNYFPKIKIILIQNSFRYGWKFNNVLYGKKPKKKFKVDYFLTIGDGIQKKYIKFIDAKYISIGSIQNNEIKKKNIASSKYLVFISQFKNWKYDEVTLDENNKLINLHKSYLQSDKIILTQLYDLCLKNKFKLLILCRSRDPELTEKEINYYRAIVPGKNIKFLKQKKRFESYKIINKFLYFVSIDSTLAYECLAKGKRVAYINFRYSFSKFKGGRNHRYGWPNFYARKGFFWTNSFSKKEVARVINNIIYAKKKKWNFQKKKYIDPTISFDSENKKFKNFLKKI